MSEAVSPSVASGASPRWARSFSLSLVFAILLAAAGYAWKGSPALIGAKPAPAPVAANATNDAAGGVAQTGIDPAQFEAMVDKLRTRLEGEPNNLEGWTMLARSYMVLDKPDLAAKAFERAVTLSPKDAGLVADLAVAVGLRDGRSLEGQASQLIARALAIDAENPKALSLAGSLAFERGDWKGAIKHWERALAKAEPGSEYAQQLQGSLTEARARASGVGADVATATATATAAGGSSNAASPADTKAAANVVITGTARLSPEVAAKVGPDQTVFIFARAERGSKMPLAIARHRVRDLPLSFKLDDSMAMSPQARLSTAERVVVGVRVSLSGQAAAQPGDFEALSAPITVSGAGAQRPLPALDMVVSQTVR